MNAPILELKSVQFGYAGSTPVLQDVSVQIHAGEWVCLLGNSGIGKTTLLHIIAGQFSANHGEVLRGEGINIASVYQNYVLFPHLSVLGNILLVLRRKEPWHQRLGDNEAAELQALAILKQVNMDSHANAMPHTLSGGQQQRVAIGQALAQKAQLLLLDEPFGALDESVRNQLQELLIKLQQQYHFGLLLVTHDVEEALYLGHKIYLLRAGEQGATVEQYPISGSVRAIPEIKQSEAFFKQLQDLRACFYRSAMLKSDPALITSAIDRGLIDEAILVELESQADEVWVISKELRQDMDNPLIHKVVSANLQRNVKYQYIIPEGDTLAANNLKRLLSNFGTESEKISVCTLSAETSVFHFGEVIFYDPQTSKRQGYSYLNGDDKGLMIRLPDDFVGVHVGMISELGYCLQEGLL